MEHVFKGISKPHLIHVRVQNNERFISIASDDIIPDQELESNLEMLIQRFQFEELIICDCNLSKAVSGIKKTKPI